MMTFHEFLKTKCEGMWLNDKNAEPGLSNVNPLQQPKPETPKPTVPKLKPLSAAQKPKPLTVMPKQAGSRLR